MRPSPRQELWGRVSGLLLEQWDDTTRRYTAWDHDGKVKESRDYTPTEDQAADQRVNAANLEGTNSEALESRLRAALVANAAFLANKARTEQDRDAQLDHLTRTVNAMIRTRYDGLLDDISDT